MSIISKPATHKPVQPLKLKAGTSRLDKISQIKAEQDRLDKELNSLTTWEEDIGNGVTDAITGVSDMADDMWSSFKGLFAD